MIYAAKESLFLFFANIIRNSLYILSRLETFVSLPGYIKNNILTKIKFQLNSSLLAALVKYKYCYSVLCTNTWLTHFYAKITELSLAHTSLRARRVEKSVYELVYLLRPLFYKVQFILCEDKTEISTTLGHCMRNMWIPHNINMNFSYLNGVGLVSITH